MKLSPKGRNRLRASQFAMPDSRRFPIHDKSHARFAIPAATRSLRAGNITPAQAAAIKAKARARLGGR